MAPGPQPQPRPLPAKGGAPARRPAIIAPPGPNWVRPLKSASVSVKIKSKTPIKNVYSATHEVKTERPDDKHAVVTYEAKDLVPGEDFRLFFDSGEGQVSASTLSYRPKGDEDGYFLLLASPKVDTGKQKPLPKNGRRTAFPLRR